MNLLTLDWFINYFTSYVFFVFFKKMMTYPKVFLEFPSIGRDEVAFKQSVICASGMSHFIVKLVLIGGPMAQLSVRSDDQAAARFGELPLLGIMLQ